MMNLNQRVRTKLYQIIFGTSTRAGRLFDIVLLYTILLSLIVVMLESVPSINKDHGNLLRLSEWILTFLFTFEYIVRLYASPKPFLYIKSFLGVVDFISFFPTYLIFLFPGLQFLLAFRAVRLLRVFRILKLQRYIKEIKVISRSLLASRYKIFVFMVSVFSVVIIVGTLMYLIEGPENGFTSIPESIYWAVVTITTVGYGDIAPITFAGKLLASILMLTGYSIIAVPTGIITVEFSKQAQIEESKRVCSNCNSTNHDIDSLFCKYCGGRLEKLKDDN
ncbi:MAG TPA: ion transporter [Tenuifilaceae bacterium]|nr:ion transporter [Tenuifilaceae bacterium]